MNSRVVKLKFKNSDKERYLNSSWYSKIIKSQYNSNSKFKKFKDLADVRVFTSIPPKVDGSLKFFLIVSISEISWLSKTPKPSNLAARIVWWGEDGSGAIFHPHVIGTNNERLLQTTARYAVKSGIKQLRAYLQGIPPNFI